MVTMGNEELAVSAMTDGRTDDSDRPTTTMVVLDDDRD